MSSRACNSVLRAVPRAAALLIALAAPAEAARDVLSIGNAAARPGTVAHLPVYIRDTSGTTLGVDTGADGARIQSFRWTATFTNPSSIDGCKSSTPSAQCQMTFTPAGVLAALNPSTAIIVTGTNSISVRYAYDRQSQRIPFTSDSTTPGDLIGTIDALISNAAPLGSAVAFTFNVTADEPVLSDNLFSGPVTEGVGGELEVNGGAITIADTDCVVAPTQATVSLDWSGACSAPTTSCTVGQTIIFRAAGDYSYRDCDSIAWNFGDGKTGSGRTVTHAYDVSALGSNTVTMTVTNPAGSAAVPQTFNIVPGSSGEPVPCTACSADAPDAATVGELVTFNAKFATCKSPTVQWQFSDGTSAIGQTITRVFFVPVPYDWTMTAVSAGFGCTARGTIVVKSAVGQSPCCAADVPQAGVINKPVTFRATPLQTCSPSDYVWDFGDGTTEHTTSPVTIHLYASTGSFNWMLLTSSGVACTTGGTIAVELPPPPKRRAARP